jgi:hypothetical protein
MNKAHINLVCNSGCAKCKGSLSTECLSCKTGFYLKLTNSKVNFGTCTAKVAGSPI